MNVRGFFKNVIGSEQQGSGADAPQTDSTTGSGVTGFLSGTSRLLDTVQSKKNGLLNDISSKLGGIKMGVDLHGRSSQSKKKTKHGDAEDGDESSASEYGDEGDKPMYAEQPPLEHSESVDSVDSMPDNEAEQCRSDIRNFVSCILQQKPISMEQKAEFQNYVMHHTGRSAFAKELKKQTVNSKEILESILIELGQYVTHILVHCNENDDFAPATQLMQTSFTLYHEVRAMSMDDRGEQRYLFTLLRDQPIWQSMRFWNAAFFLALQGERRKQTVPTGLRDEEALMVEKEMQENVAFIQISKFLWRMRAFGIQKESCTEFLRKHASAENLSKDTCRTLNANLQKLFEIEEQQENL